MDPGQRRSTAGARPRRRNRLRTEPHPVRLAFATSADKRQLPSQTPPQPVRERDVVGVPLPSRSNSARFLGLEQPLHIRALLQADHPIARVCRRGGDEALHWERQQESFALVAAHP